MRLVTYAQLRVEKGIVYSRVHLMRLVAQKKFPSPVPLSDRRIAWLETEIDAWIKARADSRVAKAA